MRLVQVIAGGAAIAGGVMYANWLLTVDPLSSYRTKLSKDRNEEIGLELKDIDFTIHDGSKQVGVCRAEKIDVRRDRQRIDLYNIKNGKIFSEKEQFLFTTQHASYEQRKQLFAALKGAQLKGKDLDLKTDGFTYHRRMEMFRTVGKIKGKLFGGDVIASNFVYSPKEKAMSAGPIVWKGDGSKLMTDLPGARAQTKWEISSDLMKVKGDIWTYTKGYATDGEVIIRAKTIVHNRKTDVVTATGDVLYFSAKANMTCKEVTVYRKEKRAVLTGDVTMLLKPSDQERLEEGPIAPFRPIVPESIASGRPVPPPTNDQSNTVRQGNSFRKFPTQVWAERIEYFYGKGSRRANISGKPQARQELPDGGWRHVWTSTAFYDGEAETLKLNSSPGKRDTRVRNSVGDDLVAIWFKVSTKENTEDEWEAEGIQGSVISDDEPGAAPPPGTSNPPGLSGRIGG